MIEVKVDCTVAFVRSSLLVIRRLNDGNILDMSVSLPFPIGPPGVVSIETTLLDVCTIITLLASSALFLRMGFKNIFDSIGSQRELHKWKRWGKSGQSKWSRADPAQILLYFTVNAAMKTKRQLIFLGLGQVLIAHVYLVMMFTISDPTFADKEPYSLLFLFVYTLALTMGLKVTWDLVLRELGLILDMRLAWAWVVSKLKDKTFHSKKVKLNDGSQESLVFSLFDHDLGGHKSKQGSEEVNESSGYVSGGYSSGEEGRNRRKSIATGGLYRAKMEALQRKSAACAALFNLFNLKPCSMPCGVFPPFSVEIAEEKLAAISLDLATLEVSIIEGAQKEKLSHKAQREGAAAASDMDAMDVAAIGLLSTRYIRQKNRSAFFHLVLWMLNAVAVLGLTYAITSFFDPSVAWLSITTTSTSGDPIVESTANHSLSHPIVRSGLLVADVALALEALAIFSKYQL